ncbi:mechanosensitive ion channel family protein [Marinobacter caseinilyticus]|uniref:mechanosensitive ion channel family protein n=1 Tax=Marinobacter caseinilyticus TaxID=2692195 RepID=UPI00140BCB70|nr:mechanosensitive ion channel family protein [Marinobacter caseinilyticus]
MLEETPAYLDTWIEQWNILSESWRIGIAIFALVLLTAVVAFMASRIITKLERKCSKSANLWDDAFLHALRKPAVGFVWLQGIYWAAEVAYRYSDAEIFSANGKVLELGFIWLLVWTVLRLVKQSEFILASPVKMQTPMDYTTVTAISKLSRAVVIITAVLIVMQTLGYSISGVLAFGGVGGIAIGFAAKDLLANFFGGFIIHLDRPFKVGDWVRSPDRNIEGTVEEIGWRLTTIRTFDKRPLYVPNAIFTTIAVENPSRMTNRRISETIGVRYADVSQVASIVEDIRSMLEQHEDIDAEQTLIVNFLAFNASSLDIMVYAFTETTNWVEFHKVKQSVLLNISEIIEGYGAEVAFPTRTLHLPDGVRLAGINSDTNDQAGSQRPPGHDKQKPRSDSRTDESDDSEASVTDSSATVRSKSGPGSAKSAGSDTDLGDEE